MRLIDRPSPNHGARRDGARPDIVVLHYTAMPSAEAALDRLCDPSAEVSAHYLIARDGTVFRLVPEDRRAWHAGAGEWAGCIDVNSRSIGIELDNDGDSPFAAPLMAALEALLAQVVARHAIPPERVIAHSDMAPGRKGDPGPRFDWRRLARLGLGVWPEAGDACEPDEFVPAALAIGYPDLAALPVLDAFRLRFRPGAEGPLSSEDAAIAAAIARRWPARRA